MSSSSHIRTLRVRIKDRHASALRSLSCDTNMVWNYCQELSLKVLDREQRFMSAFDMAAYTKGATKEAVVWKGVAYPSIIAAAKAAKVRKSTISNYLKEQNDKNI